MDKIVGMQTILLGHFLWIHSFLQSNTCMYCKKMHLQELQFMGIAIYSQKEIKNFESNLKVKTSWLWYDFLIKRFKLWKLLRLVYLREWDSWESMKKQNYDFTCFCQKLSGLEQFYDHWTFINFSWCCHQTFHVVCHH